MSRSKKIALWWFAITMFCSVLILIGAASVENVRSRNTKDLTASVMSGWERSTTGEKNQEGKYIIRYTNKLGDIAKGGESLMFFTYHGDVYVYSDDVLMYSMYMDKSRTYFNTVSGDAWHCIYIPEDMEGKNIEVTVRTDYASYLDYEPTFYIGDRMTIVKNELLDGILNLLIVFIMFIVGLVVIVYSILSVRNRANSYDLIYLGVFTIMLSVWFLINMPIINMISDTGTVLTYMSYLILGAVSVPLILFEKRLMDVKYGKICDILCKIVIATQIYVYFVQLLGYRDMKETLIMTHLSIGVSICGLVVLLIINFISTGWKNLNGLCKLNMVCGLMTALGVGADILLFYINTNASRDYIFSKLTFLVHVITLCCYSMRETQRLMRKGREAQKYENLAYRDDLTGILNRTACNDDMKHMDITEGIYTVLMFDLNNLKMCNDTLGHNFGDEYIKTCARFIKDAYASIGNCYRIGGDEFCVIGKDISEEDINACYKIMQKSIDEYNIANPKINMSVAYGYATYDAKRDEDLKDTRGRADKAMYKNKISMKANRA